MLLRRTGSHLYALRHSQKESHIELDWKWINITVQFAWIFDDDIFKWCVIMDIFVYHRGDQVSDGLQLNVD